MHQVLAHKTLLVDPRGPAQLLISNSLMQQIKVKAAKLSTSVESELFSLQSLWKYRFFLK